MDSSTGLAKRWVPLSSHPCLPFCWSHCKQQGLFAPRALPRFAATTDPSATLSPSTDFLVSPVIRFPFLHQFLTGTRRVSPVALPILVILHSLSPLHSASPLHP